MRLRLRQKLWRKWLKISKTNKNKQMSRYNKDIGNWGENRAAEFLEANGFVIIERNFRSRFGEIDIIAEKEAVIHFIEVKTRSTSSFGSPFDAINSKKLKHILKTAQFYMLSKKLRSKFISIDAIGILNNQIEFIQGINVF